MARPWADVAADPKFQSLSTSDQEAARNSYFDENVAPRVDPTELGDARTAFDAETKLSTKAAPAAQSNPDTSGGLSDLPIIGPATYGILTGVPGGKALAARGREGIQTIGEALGGDKAKTYEQNRSDIEKEANHAFSRGPVSALISGGATLAEGLATGGALVKGAAALPIVGKAIAAAAAPTIEAGAGLAPTAAKLAVAGAANATPYAATAGAIEGGAKGTNPADIAEKAATGAVKEGVMGAVGGAALGPVAGGVTAVAAPVVRQIAGTVASKLAPVAAPAVRSITRVAQNVAGNSSGLDPAIKLISSRLKQSPDELKAAVLDFMDKTGQKPTVQDVMSIASQRSVADVAQSQNAAGDVFNTAKQTNEANMPAAITAAVKKGGPSPTTQQVAQAAADENEKAIAPVRDKLVTLPEDPEKGPAAVAPKLRRLISNQVTADNDPAAMDALENGQVKYNTLYNVRQTLGDLNQKNPGMGYDALRTKLDNMMQEQVPEHANVRSTFENSAKIKAGFEAGRTNQTAAEANTTAEGKSLSAPDSIEAQQGGTRRRLVDQAQASQKSAVGTAYQLAEPTSAAAETTTLTAKERSGLSDAADRLAKAHTSAVNVAPSSLRSDEAQTAKDIGEMAKTALLAGAHSTSLFKAELMTRVMTRLRVGKDTGRKFAEALTDPDKTQPAIDLLRKARLNEGEIRDIVAQSAKVAGATGGQGAQALGR